MPRFSIKDVFEAEQKRLAAAAEVLAVESNLDSSPEAVAEAKEAAAEATKDVADKLADSDVYEMADKLSDDHKAMLAAAAEQEAAEEVNAD